MLLIQLVRIKVSARCERAKVGGTKTRDCGQDSIRFNRQSVDFPYSPLFKVIRSRPILNIIARFHPPP